MQVFFTSERYHKGNKVNMPGVGLTKVNRMLPPCPSSFRHKQALCFPDDHLAVFYLYFFSRSGSSLIAILKESHLEHVSVLGLRNPRLKSVLNTLQYRSYEISDLRGSCASVWLKFIIH